MPQLDATFFPPQLIWLAITFLLFYILMARVALPRISQVMESRQKKIDDNLGKAEQLRAEGEADATTYENMLEESRDQARAIIHEVSQQLSVEAAERQASLGEELVARIKEAEAHIREAKQDAMDGIREAAGEVAGHAVQRLIDVMPSADAVARAIDGAQAGED